MKHKKFTIKRLVILFLALFFAINVVNLNLINNIRDLNNQAEIHSSAEDSFQEQWISNPNFASTDNWTSTNGGLGDPTDMDAYISDGVANYEILGDKKTFSYLADPPQNSDWSTVQNPEFPYYPDIYEINSSGACVTHYWHEEADQSVAINWDQNFTLPVNMSDYEITSASLSAVVNGSVATFSADPPDYSDGVDTANDGCDQFATGDYVRFYVLLSDLNKDKVYEAAYNQTYNLGQEADPEIDKMYDTQMIPVTEETLIFFLTSILNSDDYNFTLTIGMRIWCEDNFPQDSDWWQLLIIKSVNLNFTYEKRINQQTSMSWNQVGNKISESITITNYTSFEVTEATLNFEYKINDTWPSSSPNSEIRILMNNIIHTETIKLSTATTVFQNASQDGFDITSLISDDVNLSIQVFLADEFELDKVIAVSIDNVYLNISYTVFFADYQTNLQLFLNGDNKTSTPSIELYKGQMLNITVKYTNKTGGHIPGANIQLTGEGIIEALNETTNQYTIIINVSQELSMDDNYLNIEATKPNYQTKLINPTINVRKLWGEIKTLSGEETINIASGEAFLLQIILNDTDNNELIEGATVQYTWDLDPIPRVLTEDNGVYEGSVLYEGGNPPDGLYTITISVVGGVGDDYNFEHFHPPDGLYTITLNVGSYVPSPEPDLSWLLYLLIFGLGGAIIGFATIFSLYIKYWRFPPLVRKIRSLRKKVSKAKKTKPVMVSKREEIIKNNLQDSVKILSLELIQPEKIEKIEKFDIKNEDVN